MMTSQVRSPAVVKLNGGLGNQLFQAAFAIAVAKVRRQTVLLDATTFTPGGERAYGLGAFAQPLHLANSAEIAAAQGWSANLLGNLGMRLVSRLHGRRWTPATWFVEQEGVWRPEVVGEIRRTYLEGYWQDERYHLGIATEIAAAFELAQPPPAAVATLAELAASAPSVMVHVRRGDYLSNPVVNAFHGIHGADYYRAALDRVRSLAGSCRAFVFSDAPTAARSLLDWPTNTVFVDGDPARPHEDLHIMRACRHHVLANSSLSWWAARLRRCDDGVVIAPARWYAAATPANDTICPAAWTRI